MPEPKVTTERVFDEYKAMHARSIEDPDGFWGEIATVLALMILFLLVTLSDAVTRLGCRPSTRGSPTTRRAHHAPRPPRAAPTTRRAKPLRRAELPTRSRLRYCAAVAPLAHSTARRSSSSCQVQSACNQHAISR